MSTVETPALPGAGTVVSGDTVPVVKKTAIQIIEEQLANFAKQKDTQVANVQAIEKQREQAIANVHAIEGAMQGAQRLLTLLRIEVAKAEAEAAKLSGDALEKARQIVAAAEAAKLSGDALEKARQIVAAAEAEAKKL